LNKLRTYALHEEYRGAAVPQIGEADVVRSVCWRSDSKFRRSVLEGYTGRKNVDSSTVIDDNSDDNRADIERYVAAHTCRF
jgi:hypothetical protein